MSGSMTTQKNLAERLGVDEEELAQVARHLTEGEDFTRHPKKGMLFSVAGVAKLEALLTAQPDATHPEKKEAAAPVALMATVHNTRCLNPYMLFAHIGERMVTVRVHLDKRPRLVRGDVLEVQHYMGEQYIVKRYPKRLGGGVK